MDHILLPWLYPLSPQLHANALVLITIYGGLLGIGDRRELRQVLCRLVVYLIHSCRRSSGYRIAFGLRRAGRGWGLTFPNRTLEADGEQWKLRGRFLHLRGSDIILSRADLKLSLDDVCSILLISICWRKLPLRIELSSLDDCDLLSWVTSFSGVVFW